MIQMTSSWKRFLGDYKLHMLIFFNHPRTRIVNPYNEFPMATRHSLRELAYENRLAERVWQANVYSLYSEAVRSGNSHARDLSQGITDAFWDSTSRQ